MKGTLVFQRWLAYGAAAAASFTSVFITIRWEWSFLMDEVANTEWMPHVPGLWGAFASYTRDLWHDGRFYPVKYLANFLKWKYLPLDPDLFRWVGLFVLASSLAICSIRLAKLLGLKGANFWGAAVFVAGMGILQRPFLDAIVLTSIAETWVMLFLSLGFYFFPERKPAYRVFFLLASLSKEPAILIFFCTALAHFGAALKSRPSASRMWYLRAGAFDLVVFALLAVLMRTAMRSGLYLADYSFFQISNLRTSWSGLVKIGLGGAPFVALIGVLALGRAPAYWRAVAAEGFKAEDDRSFRWMFAALAFFPGYLYLVSPRGVAGYLIIPATFTLYLALAWFALVALREFSASWDELPAWRRAIFPVCFALVLGQSLYRFERYSSTINETNRALRTLFFAGEPRLILVNGNEAADLGRHLATQNGVASAVVEFSPATLGKLRPCAGDVVFLELSGYFSRLSLTELTDAGKFFGGWRGSVDGGVYRVFFASQKPAAASPALPSCLGLGL